MGVLTISMFVIGLTLWYGDFATTYSVTDVDEIGGDDYIGVEGEDNAYI